MRSAKAKDVIPLAYMQQAEGHFVCACSDLSFDECSRWCAPAQRERSHHSKPKQLNTMAVQQNSLSFCKCVYDGKCRKVEAWVYHLWEKSLRELHSVV